MISCLRNVRLKGSCPEHPVFSGESRLRLSFRAELKWWETQPKAWKICRENPESPAAAMRNYYDWLNSFKMRPVFVGYPTAYDFMWVYWYLIRFVGASPFSHSALDIKTMAMTMLKKPYRESIKSNMPKKWFDNLPHTHKAVDDALEQGALFCNMLAELKRKPL